MGMDYEKEKQEVIDAGRNALKSLKAARAELNSARNWGIFDIIGGGIIATFIKHRKIKAANELLNDAMWQLKQFRKELDDIDYVDEDYTRLGELGMAADYIFDSLLTDIYVQTKIADMKARVNEAIERVERILDSIQ